MKLKQFLNDPKTMLFIHAPKVPIVKYVHVLFNEENWGILFQTHL